MSVHIRTREGVREMSPAAVKTLLRSSLDCRYGPGEIIQIPPALRPGRLRAEVRRP